MRCKSIRRLPAEMDQEVNRGSYFMKRITLGMVGVLVALSQAGTDAQGAKPPQLATDITAAEVQAVIKAPTGGGDRQMKVCLLYTSDAADERSSVDLGGRR